MTSWKLFVVKPDKTPYANCPQCGTFVSPDHDREACDCLVCHGFYAATDDPVRLHQMGELVGSHWAVRTGAASGIIVLDAEGGVQGNGMTGLETFDDFESWTRGIALPPTNLIAVTPSGGLHRYYEYVPGVRSRNRVLPGVDVKSDGGYVLLPNSAWVPVLTGADAGGERRRWTAHGEPGRLGPELVAWLASNRGGHGGGGGGGDGRGSGYDYERFVAEGCPSGFRDEFANELIFRLRKSGVDRETATRTARNHWMRVAQPPDATYHMPWHHWEYKIERIWRTVRPDVLGAAERGWVERYATLGEGRVGRVTLSRGGEE